MGYLLIALGLVVAAIGVVMVVKNGKSESEIVATERIEKPEPVSVVDEGAGNVANAISENRVNSTSGNAVTGQQVSKTESEAVGNAVAEQTAKEKGNAFEAYIADILKGCHIKIKQWNQGTVTSAGAMGENALNPDFYVNQPYGNSSIEYWLECKWRKDIKGKFTFPEAQIERYRKTQHDSKRKVFFIFGIGGEPSNPGSVYIVPLDSVKECSVTREDLKPFYHSDPATQLMPRMSRYFKEEVFKKK